MTFMRQNLNVKIHYKKLGAQLALFFQMVLSKSFLKIKQVLFYMIFFGFKTCLVADSEISDLKMIKEKTCLVELFMTTVSYI